jgi:tRNA-Thr(GGU) m(6)t(6)A37 methyltransferase TsaA
MTEILLKPIGKVISEITEPQRGIGEWDDVVSEIVIEEDLNEHLEGLEEFSHILVVFWMHKSPVEGSPPRKVHPKGRADLPLVGLFATRAPYRPNSLGVSTVKLIERRGNILIVKGLDALNGTPVIDIKPYMPPIDDPTEVRMPDWVKKLRT